jgi:hypothetical protein
MLSRLTCPLEAEEEIGIDWLEFSKSLPLGA